MDDILPLELRKLGLKDKEVKVYLAGLELGPTTMQKLAIKAGIKRPTAYEIVKILARKNLFQETRQGKKRYVQVQSPEKILSLLRLQKREIEEREREFVRIIAALETKYSSKEKGEISAFRGQEGINLLYEKLSFTSSYEISVLSSELNLQDIQKRNKIYETIQKRLGKIEVKEMYPAKSETPFPYGKRKVLSSPYLPPGTLIIFDRAIFFPNDSQSGYLMDHPFVGELLKSLFRALWEQLP
ncbi:MAG: helix-turn-helix domain-containing protein [Patescibacteria group bacterium]